MQMDSPDNRQRKLDNQRNPDLTKCKVQHRLSGNVRVYKLTPRLHFMSSCSLISITCSLIVCASLRLQKEMQSFDLNVEPDLKTSDATQPTALYVFICRSVTGGQQELRNKGIHLCRILDVSCTEAHGWVLTVKTQYIICTAPRTKCGYI